MIGSWSPDPAVTTVADLRSRALVGAPVGDTTSLPGRVRRAVVIAETTGAPLVPAIDAVVAALDDDRRRQRAIHVATAQARAVATGLLALPVVLVPVLGRLLDLDVVGFYGSTIGYAVLAVAGSLFAVGAVLVGRSLRRATAPPRDGRARGGWIVAVALVVGVLASWIAGLAVVAVALVRRRPPGAQDGVPREERDEIADLLATAVSAGLAPSRACEAVAEVGSPRAATGLRRLSLALVLDQPVADPALAPIDAAIRTSAAWGSPAAPALRAIATDLRADSLTHALAAAEQLPAQLTLPTALCLLPASVLLVGAPLVAEGLAAAAGVR